MHARAHGGQEHRLLDERAQAIRQQQRELWAGIPQIKDEGPCRHRFRQEPVERLQELRLPFQR